MACKCIRILKVVMMGFLILIIEVQTNHLLPTSFSHYALPIQYVHSSQLDGVEELVHTCFRDWIQYCIHNHIRIMEHAQECIHLGATICLIQIVKEGEKGSPILECFMACLQHRDIACYKGCH